MDTPEHQAKYPKLAAEYSKVRAQNHVLKRAVVEEQQKVAKHNEVLQSLRRCEQENDSLSFRNQQLSCRLQLLQHDLQNMQRSGSKGHKKSNSSGSSNNKLADDRSSINSNSVGLADGSASGGAVDIDVLMTELQGKITENASLHARVSDLEQRWNLDEGETLERKLEHFGALQQQNKEITEELRCALEALELHERAAKGRLEQLESDKITAEITVQQQSRQINRLQQQLLDNSSNTSSSSSRNNSNNTPVASPLHQNNRKNNSSRNSSNDSNTIDAPPADAAFVTVSPVKSPTVSSISSSSSSYVSLAPFSSATETFQSTTVGEEYPRREASSTSPTFRLDLPGNKLKLSTSVLDTTEVCTAETRAKIPPLGRDICHAFLKFIRLYSEAQKQKLTRRSSRATDGSTGGEDEEKIRGLETVKKVQQGLEYWEKLAPLLHSVMSRTVGVTCVGDDCSSGDALKCISGDDFRGMGTASLSSTAASTLAHLRLVSSIPAPASIQRALRSVQSTWSAVLPYLSAVAANKPIIYSGGGDDAPSSYTAGGGINYSTTLVKLLRLLADKCDSLAGAVAETYGRWEGEGLEAVGGDCAGKKDGLEAMGGDQARKKEGLGAVGVVCSYQGEESSGGSVGVALVELQTVVQKFTAALRITINKRHLDHQQQRQINAATAATTAIISIQANNGIGSKDAVAGGHNQRNNTTTGLDATNRLVGPDNHRRKLTGLLPTLSVGGFNNVLGGGGDSSINATTFHQQYPQSALSSPVSLNSPDDSTTTTSNLSSNGSGKRTTTQSDDSVAKLAKLHRQREHWRLEFHLLSHKYNKMMRILKDRNAPGGLDDHPDRHGAVATTGGVLATSILGEVYLEKPSDVDTTGAGQQEEQKDGHSDGKLQQIGGDSNQKKTTSVVDSQGRSSGADGRRSQESSQQSTGHQADPSHERSNETVSSSIRESLVRHHLCGRLSRLYVKFSILSSMATALADDKASAMRRLTEVEHQDEAGKLELDSVREEKTRLAEELKMTCKNYEEQISVMSDHLADVNGILASYEEDRVAKGKTRRRRGH